MYDVCTVYLHLTYIITLDKDLSVNLKDIHCRKVLLISVQYIRDVNANTCLDPHNSPNPWH